jgi:hypothetical protein
MSFVRNRNLEAWENVLHVHAEHRKTVGESQASSGTIDADPLIKLLTSSGYNSCSKMRILLAYRLYQLVDFENRNLSKPVTLVEDTATGHDPVDSLSVASIRFFQNPGVPSNSITTHHGNVLRRRPAHHSTDSS